MITVSRHRIKRLPLRRDSTVQKQRGVTLVIALIMLIAMTLAGLALFRQVGTGVIVARNLTFREGATAAADLGVEAARAWLTDPAQKVAGKLDNADVGAGYFPAWCNVSINASNLPDANGDGNTDDCNTLPSMFAFTARGYNWLSAGHIADINGNQVDYVIHRMCNTPGAVNVSGQQCNTVGSESGTRTRDIIDYDHQVITGTIQPYYRITTRVTGPMNTVVYTQTIIY